MKKKGFTIVEILAVIVVLAIIMLLVAPSLFASRDKAKEKAYKTKVSTLETMTATFGQDNYGNITQCKVNDNGKCSLCPCGYEKEGDTVKCGVILSSLVPEYITADNDNKDNRIEDPRNSNLFLDDYTMIITINTKLRTVKATFNEKDCNK